MLTGCMNATTEMVATYPAKPASSVLVLEHGERLPEEAQPIGKLNTRKGGDECQRNAILKKAINLTASLGGNVLRLTNDGDTCHEVHGVIALLPDDAPLPSGITRPHPALFWQEEPDTAKKRTHLGILPRQTIRVSAGPAFLTSKYRSRYQKLSPHNPGFSFSADFEFFGRSGMGGFLTFRGGSSSLGHDHLMLANFAAGIVQQYMVGQRWRLSWAVGPGFGYFESDENNGWRFNGLARLSAEYMLTPILSIGLDLNGALLSLKDRLPTPSSNVQWLVDKNYVPKEYFMGQIGLAGGLRLYF
ncbi:MAG: hypothetical protein K6D37_04190 [Prevotella sp.]|nr:hypothetical protein [Prevotella sp.]